MAGRGRESKAVRPIALAIAVAAVLAAGAAVATQVRWSGGLGHGYANGTGVEMPVRAGTPFSVGMTILLPRDRIRIESVRLHGASDGIDLIGSLLEHDGMTGTYRGFPPTLPRLPRRQAVGAVLMGGSQNAIVVGLRASAPGRFVVKGIDVLYREKWHGVELRRRAHTGIEVSACAVASSAKALNCKPPPLAISDK
jgi:hypothetical protein